MPTADHHFWGSKIYLGGDKARAVPQARAAFGLDMGQMVLSKKGEVDLYSGSFCGCLGLVVVPVGKWGGMISHIHESGNTDLKYDYLKQAAEASIAVARTEFPGCQLAAVLFRGMMPNGIPECPKLALDLKGLISVEVYDLRSATADGGSDAADQVLYRTNKQEIYLYSGNLPEGLMDKVTDDSIEARRVDVPLRMKPPKHRGFMPCHIVG